MSVAIRATDVWKSYRIYRHRTHSLKERLLSRRSAFDEFWALQGVTLEVPAGRTLGVIGPNGGGKSTFLKTLGRILTPNKGRVETWGKLSSLLELGTGFHPELAGRENVFMAGSLLGHSKRRLNEMYDEIVDFAGIGEFMELPVKDLSSGMQARLAFAVAISVDPDILLLDEVLAVGDESFQMKCYERITQFRAQGRTIVLVSHSLDNIRSLCDDAIWLDHGIVRAQGEAHDVVAQYLGDVHVAQAAAGAGSAGGDRYGSMEAEVTSVKLVDRNGVETKSFRTGDPMTIRVAYHAHTPIAEASLGFAIYRAENLAHLYGQNTHQGGIDLQLDGSGVVEFAIEDLPLLKGNYALTVAIHDHAVKHVYDWHERRFSFLVFENAALGQEAGMFHIDGKWSVSS